MIIVTVGKRTLFYIRDKLFDKYSLLCPLPFLSLPFLSHSTFSSSLPPIFASLISLFLNPLFFFLLHIRRSPMSSFTSHPISSLITSNPARISKNRSYWISNISLYICRSIRNVVIKSNQLDSFNNA